MSELLPCPFCGGEAEFQIFDNVCNVVCAECHIGTRYESLDSAEQVVAAWNARAERTCQRVEHGKKYGFPKLVCSECGYGLGDGRWRFCPKCGGRIKEKK